MKKPYIKKFTELNGYKVWVVDGTYIRNKIDIEFTNFGQHISQHGRFDFIPKDELWLDKDYAHSHEESLYLAGMVTRQNLTTQGYEYNKVLEEADLAEKQERQKTKLVQDLLKKKLHRKTLIKKIHKKLLKKYSRIGKVKVWVVRGKLVRGIISMDYVQGGHDKVYSFIPKKEVWIDDSLNPKERKFVLLHEIVERNLMCWGWVYALRYEIPWMQSTAKNCDGIEPDSAHARASEIEKYFRKHQKGVDAKIKDELRITTLF